MDSKKSFKPSAPHLQLGRRNQAKVCIDLDAMVSFLLFRVFPADVFCDLSEGAFLAPFPLLINQQHVNAAIPSPALLCLVGGHRF